MSLERARHVRRFLREPLDTDRVSVEGQPAGEAVDGKPGREQLGSKLCSYLASSPCLDIPVLGAEYTGEPLLIRTPRLSSYAAIPFAGAAGYIISESIGECLVIALNRPGHLAFVKAVGKVECERIFRECQRIPEGSRFEVGSLGAAESMWREAVQAGWVGEPMAEPVQLLEPDLVDSTDPTSCGHSVSDKHNVTSDNWTHWRVN